MFHYNCWVKATQTCFGSTATNAIHRVDFLELIVCVDLKLENNFLASCTTQSDATGCVFYIMSWAGNSRRQAYRVIFWRWKKVIPLHMWEFSEIGSCPPLYVFWCPFQPQGEWEQTRPQVRHSDRCSPIITPRSLWLFARSRWPRHQTLTGNNLWALCDDALLHAVGTKSSEGDATRKKRGEKQEASDHFEGLTLAQHLIHSPQCEFVKWQIAEEGIRQKRSRAPWLCRWLLNNLQLFTTAANTVKEILHVVSYNFSLQRASLEASSQSEQGVWSHMHQVKASVVLSPVGR